MVRHVIVPGGVNGDEFLSSMEQFDKSGSSWNIPLQRDWRIINHVLTSPRYTAHSRRSYRLRWFLTRKSKLCK